MYKTTLGRVDKPVKNVAIVIVGADTLSKPFFGSWYHPEHTNMSTRDSSKAICEQSYSNPA